MSRWRGRLVCLAQLLALFAAIAPAARAQSTFRANGRVLDQFNGWIAGASVRLFSPDRLVETKSDDNGFFEIANLDAGTYDLEVSFPGFFKSAIEDLKITDHDVQQVFTLRVGEGSGCAVLRLNYAPKPSLTYSKRSDAVNLRGGVYDVRSGLALGGALLSLSRDGQTREGVSDDKGEFLFSAGIEPGKYTLNASRASDGYAARGMKFWVTRENLTTINIYLGNTCQ